MSAPQCDGEIRRGGTWRCGNDATWNVRLDSRIANANACGHHIGQVLNDLRKVRGDDVQFVVHHQADEPGTADRERDRAVLAEVRRYADLLACSSGMVPDVDVAWKLRQILTPASEVGKGWEA